jgi:anthranilate synthase component 1
MGLGALLEVTGRRDGVEVRGPDGLRLTLSPGLESLRELLRQAGPSRVAGDERFRGGLVGYVAYDAVRYFERIPEAHPDATSPLFRFLLPEVLCIFDNFRQDLRIVAFGLVQRDRGGDDAELAALRHRLDDIEALLALDHLPIPRLVRVTEEAEATVRVTSNVSRNAFVQAIERAKAYIRAGDVFQVVVSQRLSTPTVPLEPLAIYRRLRRQNPSPYQFLLRFPDETLIGASPEVMVRLTGRTAEVRPIAGTRPRGATPAEDRRLEAELLADPKELAEHVMLLDLGRNDLGRVCEIGSISIPERMVVERYSKVMHLVSHVRGELSEGLDWLDLLAATFPAGTLSGAPKIRAMEIIDELEPSRRNVYGGAVGYIGLDGSMDLCITIRTLHLDASGASVQVGAGVVADSLPEREYQETLDKAAALLRAIGGRVASLV